MQTIQSTGRRRSSRLRAVLVATAVAGALLVPAPASALAGANIGSAPLVVFGQQEFGNTASGQYDCGPADFWNLALKSGDQVTIDWEASNRSYANELFVYPAGTTDFSINNVESLQVFSLGENNRAESAFSAGTSGIYPLIFAAEGCNEDHHAGPFDFTARDQHVIVTSLSSGFYIRANGVLVAHADLADGSAVPDGLTFYLNARWPGYGRAQYQATSSGGSLRFPLALPASARGQVVSFVVTRPADTQYLAARSVAMQAKVAWATAARSPHHRHRRHRHHHRRQHRR